MKIVTDNPFIINRKKILYDQRYSMRRLAIEIGVTAQAVAQSINGKTQSLKMHRTICNKLGVSLVNFWPELYGEEIVPPDMENITSLVVGALSDRV